MNSLLRRAVLLSAALAITVVAAWGLEEALSRRAHWPFGHTQSGHLIGWIGLAVMLLLFVYPIRKRYGPKPGWPKGWFRVHMVAGVVGPMLILVHSGAHLHALVPVLAMVTMAIVVVSGVVGQALHYLAVKRLHAEYRELEYEGLDEAEIDVRVHRLASQERAFRVWQYIHAPLTMTFVVLTLMHIAGALYFSGL